ncbi:hypothetical protein PC9H_002323 [Pleurotus ostreatus]|uniref:Uncharacterized protein n=1 Tax=Pleurotus ostreatus TaxID=5322 RepID=A0A8H6ZLE4_PLEOS|nr:uncharacterized protein PC9H_002323 [Pleurotus ostreatus]KAF7416063.1 hypothetical protein PC9H_002323 [Pleurotus ostreatus]
MKKARIREERKKRKSLPGPSTTRKSLPMVSTDIGGIPQNAVAVASAQAPTSESSGHVNKKAKISSSSSITPIDCIYQTDKDLFAHLRRIKARHRRQFTGTYSVIADPKIRASECVDSVFDALAQHAGVRGWFNIGYSTGPLGHGSQYLCSCTQTCGGKIDVRVDEDNTHPLFSGQKITVEIKH